MSYLIQTDEIALASQEKLRKEAILAGKTRALELKLVTNPDALVERPADYPMDFVPAATRAGLAGWLTMPLLVVAANYSVFADNVPAAMTPQVPNNQIWVFYKVNVQTLNLPVSQLRFATGTAVNRKAQFDLEILYAKLSADGYFTKPVVYDPQEIVTCTVQARIATLAAAIVVLGCFVIEPIQVNLV